MNRLTYKSSTGDYGSTKKFENDYVEKCTLRNALGRFEDLGYTPEQLKTILKAFLKSMGNINCKDLKKEDVIYNVET